MPPAPATTLHFLGDPAALDGFASDQGAALTRPLAGMPLAEFRTAGLSVRVHSRLLGEDVILASDNATVERGSRLVVYRSDELRQIAGAGAEGLRRLHKVKRLLGSVPGW